MATEPGESVRISTGTGASATRHGVLKVEFSGVIAEMNEAARAMLGYLDDPPIGEASVEVLVPERFRTQARIGLERLQHGERHQMLGQTVLMRVLCAEDREVPLLVTLIDQGTTLVAFLTDVEAPEPPGAVGGDWVQRLSGAPNLGAIGTFDWTAGEPAKLSDELCEIYGLEPGSEITLESYVEMVHPRDRHRVTQLIESARRSEPEVATMQWRVVRPDQQVRKVRFQAAATTDGDGNLVRLVGTVHDLTELAGAQQALAAHAAVDAALGEWDTTSGGIVGLLRRLILAMDWAYGTLWVPEARSDALVCRARWSRPEDRPQPAGGLAPGRQFALGEGLPGRVWATRETLTGGGAIAFAVQSDGDFLGVLEFHASSRSEFPATLRQTLRLIGQTYLGEFLLRHRGTLGSSPLTGREREVLQLATDGGSSAVIAGKLVVSTSTVKTHFEHIYQKLGVADRAEAVAEGFRQGIVQ